MYSGWPPMDDTKGVFKNSHVLSEMASTFPMQFALLVFCFVSFFAQQSPLFWIFETSFSFKLTC
jgi:hypothetical protein